MDSSVYLVRYEDDQVADTVLLPRIALPEDAARAIAERGTISLGDWHTYHVSSDYGATWTRVRVRLTLEIEQVTEQS